MIDNMIEILLTQNKIALIDNEDYQIVINHKWCAYREPRMFNNWYAATNVRTSKGKYRSVSMHRLILGDCCEGMTVDHINHNGLDNRRSNLRIATATQQQQNRKQTKGYSRFKGVTWNKNAWAARIKHNGKEYHLGRFKNEEDAARQYNYFANLYFGEYAYLNKVEER